MTVNYSIKCSACQKEFMLRYQAGYFIEITNVPFSFECECGNIISGTINCDEMLNIYFSINNAKYFDVSPYKEGLIKISLSDELPVSKELYYKSSQIMLSPFMMAFHTFETDVLEKHKIKIIHIIKGIIPQINSIKKLHNI